VGYYCSISLDFRCLVLAVTGFKTLHVIAKITIGLALSTWGIQLRKVGLEKVHRSLRLSSSARTWELSNNTATAAPLLETAGMNRGHPMLTNYSGSQTAVPKPAAIAKIEKLYQGSGSEFIERIFQAAAESTSQFQQFLKKDPADGRNKIRPIEQYWNIVQYAKDNAPHTIDEKLVLLLLAEVTGRMNADAWYKNQPGKCFLS
jgi:hypothetical protein